MSVLIDTSVWVDHFRHGNDALVGLLRHCNQAGLPEVMELIERERLYGLGCGLVDISLLASTLITPSAALWTLDKRLADLAGRFGVAYRPKLH